jgi:hypothetical protein
MNDRVYSTGPVKEKLRDLKAHMPNASDVTCRFATCMADQLHDEVYASALAREVLAFDAAVEAEVCEHEG